MIGAVNQRIPFLCIEPSRYGGLSYSERKTLAAIFNGSCSSITKAVSTSIMQHVTHISTSSPKRIIRCIEWLWEKFLVFINYTCSLSTLQALRHRAWMQYFHGNCERMDGDLEQDQVVLIGSGVQTQEAARFIIDYYGKGQSFALLNGRLDRSLSATHVSFWEEDYLVKLEPMERDLLDRANGYQQAISPGQMPYSSINELGDMIEALYKEQLPRPQSWSSAGYQQYTGTFLRIADALYEAMKKRTSLFEGAIRRARLEHSGKIFAIADRYLIDEIQTNRAQYPNTAFVRLVDPSVQALSWQSDTPFQII